jgi:hypothetical protein
MSNAYTPTYDANTGKLVSYTTEQNAEPKVGAAMRVGSMSARSYSAQDWWQTTVITEILERRPDPNDPDSIFVRFKTGNSEYEWESF